MSIVPVREEAASAYEALLHVVLSGLAVLVPLVVTIYVLQIAVGVIGDALTPLVVLLEVSGVATYLADNWLLGLLVSAGVYESVTEVLAEVLAVVLLVAVVLVLGVAANVRVGEAAIEDVNRLFEQVPGVGAVYKSFRRMSQSALENDASNLRDVKLVEFPETGVYTLGFETARSPGPVREAVDEDDLVALFLPLAPNPVMGGFLAHVPEERVIDVDMTVEEGVRTIVTTGIGSDTGP